MKGASERALRTEVTGPAYGAAESNPLSLAMGLVWSPTALYIRNPLREASPPRLRRVAPSLPMLLRFRFLRNLGRLAEVFEGEGRLVLVHEDQDPFVVDEAALEVHLVFAFPVGDGVDQADVVVGFFLHRFGMADFCEGDASPLDGDFRELPSVGFAGELLRSDFDVRHNFILLSHFPSI